MGKLIKRIPVTIAALGLGLRTTTALAGLGLITGGLAMLSIPAALIVPGSFLLLAASFGAVAPLIFRPKN